MGTTANNTESAGRLTTHVRVQKIRVGGKCRLRDPRRMFEDAAKTGNEAIGVEIAGQIFRIIRRHLHPSTNSIYG